MPYPSLDPKLFWTIQNVLDHSKCFGRVQIVLIMSKLFWSGTNHFGQVLIRLFWTNFYDLDLSKMIWTRPNELHLSIGLILRQGNRSFGNN